MTPTFTPSATATATLSPTTTLSPTDTPTVTATSTTPVFSQAAFTYNGDGRRVQAVIQTNYASTTTSFVGNYYEVTGSSVTKYYYAGAQRIAMRKDGTLNYLLGDHLGSTSLSTDATGNVISELRYKAWGEVRYASGSMPTAYQYTGQYSYASDFGLLFYNARWYDPYLNHFTQPDSIVPDPYNPQSLNRYAYALNNPLKYTDPTGHDADCGGMAALADSYCNEAKREYYSWRQSHDTSFKTFLRAKDAYGFYYNHPEKAKKDQYAGNGKAVSSWEEVDPYTLASIYSEDVKHQFFNPISDQFIVWEMDEMNARREAGGYVDPLEWMTVAASLFITFGPDVDSGGGGSILQTGGHTLNDDTLKALGLSRDQGKSALEALKKYSGLPPNYHSTKIWSNGDVYDANKGTYIGNLFDFLP